MLALASAVLLGLAASPVSATYYLPGVVPHSYDEFESVSTSLHQYSIYLLMSFLNDLDMI